MKGIGKTIKEARLVAYFSKRKRWAMLLICLLLSLFIWLLRALDETYTKSVVMKLAPIELPARYAIQNRDELPEAISIEVTAKGSKLMAYTLRKELFKRTPELVLNVDTNRLERDGGYWSATGDQLIRQAKRTLPALDAYFGVGEDKIEVRPDYVSFSYVPMEKRSFGIDFKGQLDTGEDKKRVIKSFRLVDEDVMAYGTVTQLDSLATQMGEMIYTDTVPILIDQLGVSRHKIALQRPAEVSLSQDSVEIEVTVGELQYYFYESRAIKVHNLPANQTVRLFPSTTRVTFLSDEAVDIDAMRDEIRFYVDLNDLEYDSSRSKLKIYSSGIPNSVYLLQIDPDEVEFIIEEQRR